MENLETMEHFENTIALYKKLFRIEPNIIAHDLHPDYLATKYARELAADSAVLESHGRIAGIVLAAGGSSRLGVPKQLIPFRERPLVWHAVRTAIDAGLSPVVVVCGAAASDVRLAL